MTGGSKFKNQFHQKLRSPKIASVRQLNKNYAKQKSVFLLLHKMLLLVSTKCCFPLLQQNVVGGVSFFLMKT